MIHVMRQNKDLMGGERQENSIKGRSHQMEDEESTLMMSSSEGGVDEACKVLRISKNLQMVGTNWAANGIDELEKEPGRHTGRN